MAIIPPSMATDEGLAVFASYMGPFRNSDGSHRMVITVNSVPTATAPIRMLAMAEIHCASRDAGVALGDAIGKIVVKEIAPTLATPSDRN